MARRRTPIACAAAGLAALLSSCGSTPTKPAPADSLRLTAAITTSVVAPGEPATISFHLENVGAESITLTFPSSCQINPYVRARNPSTVVYPMGGSWVCSTVLTRLTLRAGEAAAQSVNVRAALVASYPELALRPGDYIAYATLEANEVTLRSEDLTFAVR